MPRPDHTLTIQEVLPLLDAAVEDRGADWVYPTEAALNGCHYFATDQDVEDGAFTEEGAPACIVGWVLDRLGVTVTDIVTDIGDYNETTGVDTLAAIIPMDVDTVEVLQHVQNQQDNGTPWGIAVPEATAHLR